MSGRRALIVSLLAAALGCGGTPARPAGGGPASGFAVVNSDYATTSLSLLDATGALVRPDCVNSATRATGGPAKIISGDVVLPSQPPGAGVVLIDRGNGALTSVDPTSCAIVRQIPVPGGARTNPHDLVMLSDQKAYVTRYDPNLSASDPGLAGNDVIAIDPTSGALLGRIALDAYASPAGAATALVRPDRALLVNGQVIVSLNEIDQRFTSYGEGQLIVIDPDSDAVTGTIALTGLSNCGGLAYLAAKNLLLVTCGGPFGGSTAQSGIAVVDLGASPPALARVIASAAFDGRPLGSVAEAALAGNETGAFAITNDPNDVDPDALFELDVVAGTTTAVATSGPYTFGTPVALPGLLLVPNATRSMPRIDRFDVTAAPAPAGSFTADPITNLPPREIAPY
jgi:hypothetical protein